MFLYFLYF